MIDSRTRFRLTLGLAVIVVASLGNLRLLRSPARVPSDSPAAVFIYQERLSALERRVPPGEVIHYFSDRETVSESATAFGLARFAAAPRFLVQSPPGEWLLADDRRPAPSLPASFAASFDLVDDLGDGLRLYRRRAKP